ncbi:unnamed protein product [Closterium sp. NIES-64]|nr:unnamed protein product [Closterium sp. NIES-64]
MCLALLQWSLCCSHIPPTPPMLASHVSAPSRLLTALQFPPCRRRGGAWGSTPPLPHTPPLWPCRVWEWQWRGAVTRNMEWEWEWEWEWQSAAALHPSHPQRSLQVDFPGGSGGRGGGQHSTRLGREGRVQGLGRLNQEVAVAGDMESTGSSCSPPSPPAAKGSTALSWDWKGEYRAGLSDASLRVGALKQGQESEVHPLTHLLLSPFSLPSQQHPTWTTVESPPSVHPPLPSTTPSPAA